MSLQALLREVDPCWYIGADGSGDALEPAIVVKAQSSPLGRRMLARWLVRHAAPSLLAPSPDGGTPAVVSRWTRPRLLGLVRDVGALAFAPAVRAEVRRDHVAQLKRCFGNGYLLALDNAIWDAKVAPKLMASLGERLESAAARAKTAGKPAPIHELLDVQGRAELTQWAQGRDPALADWVVLQSPREPSLTTALPEKQMLFLLTHHEARVAA